MTTQRDIPAAIPGVDEDGFLTDTEKWTQDIAEILAQEEMPKGLTPDHWIVVDFMRQYYLEFETVPPVRMLARRTGLPLRRIKQLFPTGLTKGACRIAGIPRIAISPRFLYP